MIDLRKAAEDALLFLDNIRVYEMRLDLIEKYPEVKETLRQALAQPEQEPLKYSVDVKCERCGAADTYNLTIDAAPPKREWQGLTDEEGAEIWGDAHDIDWKRLVTPKEIVKRIEAKLKEKNT